MQIIVVVLSTVLLMSTSIAAEARTIKSSLLATNYLAEVSTNKIAPGTYEGIWVSPSGEKVTGWTSNGQKFVTVGGPLRSVVIIGFADDGLLDGSIEWPNVEPEVYGLLFKRDRVTRAASGSFIVRWQSIEFVVTPVGDGQIKMTRSVNGEPSGTMIADRIGP